MHYTCIYSVYRFEKDPDQLDVFPFPDGSEVCTCGLHKGQGSGDCIPHAVKQEKTPLVGLSILLLLYSNIHPTSAELRSAKERLRQTRRQAGPECSVNSTFHYRHWSFGVPTSRCAHRCAVCFPRRQGTVEGGGGAVTSGSWPIGRPRMPQQRASSARRPVHVASARLWTYRVPFWSAVTGRLCGRFAGVPRGVFTVSRRLSRGGGFVATRRREVWRHGVDWSDMISRARSP